MFHVQYPPGRYPPEKLHDGKWFVHCEVGAEAVLRERPFVGHLEIETNEVFMVDCSNLGVIKIRNNHSLWKLLTELSATYTVEVLPVLSEAFIPWDGSKIEAHFDCIVIKRKSVS